MPAWSPSEAGLPARVLTGTSYTDMRPVSQRFRLVPTRTVAVRPPAGHEAVRRRCGSRRRTPAGRPRRRRGAGRAASGSAAPRDPRRRRWPGASALPPASSSARAASQSVVSAASRSRITGAWSRARSRSWTIVTTTSVVVRTPGRGDQVQRLQLAHRQRRDHHRVAHLPDGRVDLGEVERHLVGHGEPPAEDLEQLGGDGVEGDQLVGLGQLAVPRPRRAGRRQPRLITSGGGGHAGVDLEDPIEPAQGEQVEQAGRRADQRDVAAGRPACGAARRRARRGRSSRGRSRRRGRPRRSRPGGRRPGARGRRAAGAPWPGRPRRRPTAPAHRRR